MKKIQQYLCGCLYFNANIFARQLSKIAEKEFSSLNISAPHASVMLLVYDNPGISPKELSSHLQLSPSTITRFVDVLVKKKLLKRKTHGKSSFIYTTPEGNAMKSSIADAWIKLYQEYTRILSPAHQNALSGSISQANEKLQADH